MGREVRKYQGEVEGILRGSEVEILRELIAVIEATQDKSIRLTKAGIPPKPLWSAVNDRLLWQDPPSILYDWDECDQVRFIYCLAEQLMLVKADPERQLEIGPGADQFYFALPSRRAEMLMRAYLNVDDWDERCDARNEHGHRQNFGQTFRRDFLRDTEFVRSALVDALRSFEVGSWFRATELAWIVSDENPDILISEDDEVPDIPDGEPEAEIRRLVDYWVFFAARFGWVDLARTPERSMDEGGDRLFSVTELGKRLIDADLDAGLGAERKALAALRPFVVQPNNEVILYRDDADTSDEYLLRRIGDPARMPDWDEPVVVYQITPDSLTAAIDAGLDPDIIRTRLVERARSEVPSSFIVMLDDAVRQRTRVTLSQGITAVELDEAAEGLAEAIAAKGFLVYDGLVLVTWDRWAEFSELVGGEPTEGFRYPPEEPLGSFTGNKLRLKWPVLPMMARDLLDALGLDGDPPTVVIDEERLAFLARDGWSERAVAEALSVLTGGVSPKRLTEALSR